MAQTDRDDAAQTDGPTGHKRSRFKPRLPRTVTTWLIVINLAFFAVDRVLVYFFQVGREFQYYRPVGKGQVEVVTALQGWLEYWGQFTAETAIQKLQVWRFVGFQFLHGNYVHLLFNMFVLFMFGLIVEDALGRRRYLAFYLICGVAGPIGYCLLWMMGWLVATPDAQLVGASAGVFGVLLAAAMLVPKEEVLVLGLFPVQVRDLAFVMIFVAVYTIVFFGKTTMHNAGGEAAHLGGAAMGFLLMKNPKLLQAFARSQQNKG